MQQISQGERLSTGRWTKEEHQRFMYAIMQYGKDWRRVEQYVKTRSSSQVRSHAQKFFNKLQKAQGAPAQNAQGNQDPAHLQDCTRRQEHSETEFDIERELNNEQTPSTPMELVSLIRKQSREDGGRIDLGQLKRRLDGAPAEQQLPTSFKSMSNILSAYEEVSASDQQDESFFITITRKYKKLFKQVEDFDRLIDLNDHPQPAPTRNRKRSFTLPEGSDLDEHDLDHKISQIKRKINPGEERDKARGQEREEKQEKVEEKAKKESEEGKSKRERRDSDSSIQFMPPPLNKLTTIQEQPREQDDNLSFRALLSQDKLDEIKP